MNMKRKDGEEADEEEEEGEEVPRFIRRERLQTTTDRGRG
jgi:hypothetical protein